MNQAIVLHLYFTLIFAERIVAGQKCSQTNPKVLNFVAIFGNIVINFCVLASEPFRAVFGNDILYAILIKLYHKIAYLSSFGVEFILAEDKGSVGGAPAFVFEILWVERALGVHY